MQIFKRRLSYVVFVGQLRTKGNLITVLVILRIITREKQEHFENK